MATELELRIWCDAELAARPAALLGRLVQAVDAWPQADGPWQGLKVKDPGLRTVRSVPDAADTAALERALAVADEGPVRLSTGRAFKAWRFQGTPPQLGHLRLGLDAWHPAWAPARDRRVEGDAVVWIPTAGPYVALLGDEADPAVNARVEENLDALTQLIFGVIQATDAVRLAVHTDAGVSHPLNAHAVWVRQKSDMLQDVAFVRQLATDGLPAYQVPALSQADPDAELPLHGWRPGARRRALSEALRSAGAPGPKALDRALGSGRFDFFDRGEGVFVLEYPHMLNAFMDDFYLAVMEGEQASP
ncbi:MAG: hypothetical protein H6739_42025 [Alphaproteobacteria bacterium]|nr:hypothetical protein [Alphaproteobacteria bacterium]